jgi:hypothetical protein
MTRNRSSILRVGLLVASACGVATVPGRGFDADWWSADGGGAMWSTGGSFELGGTIGQPDAGGVAMSGGTFELIGGFWTVPPCWCMSDLNNDGSRDARDVQGFADCMLGGGVNCACADMDRSGLLDMTDTSAFVSGLLAGGACP